MQNSLPHPNGLTNSNEILNLHILVWWFFKWNTKLNPSSLKWGLQQPPQNSSRPGAQKCAAEGKIAPGISKFILSVHFNKKNFKPTTYRVSVQSWEVRGVITLMQSHDFTIWLFWKYIWSDMQSKLVCKLEILSFSNIFSKNENRMFPWFFTQNSIFAYILHTKCQYLNFPGCAHFVTS